VFVFVFMFAFILLELVPWLVVESFLTGVELDEEVDSAVLESGLREEAVPRMFGLAMGRM